LIVSSLFVTSDVGSVCYYLSLLDFASLVASAYQDEGILMASDASRSSSVGTFAIGVLVGGGIAAGAAYAGYRLFQSHGNTELASPSSRKGAETSSFRNNR
jgi:hypothetical protein